MIHVKISVTEARFANHALRACVTPDALSMMPANWRVTYLVATDHRVRREDAVDALKLEHAAVLNILRTAKDREVLQSNSLRRTLRDALECLDCLRRDHWIDNLALWSKIQELSKKNRALETRNCERIARIEAGSRERVARLEARVDELEGKVFCSMCMDQDKTCALFCGHAFCEPCLVRWSETADTCPLCRQGALKKWIRVYL